MALPLTTMSIQQEINSIQFDVFENDLTDNFPIDEFSVPDGTLEYLGDGEFEYTP